MVDRAARPAGAALLLLVLACAAVAPLRAQPGSEAVATHVYRLRHQPAKDAMALVLPLLSPRGAVQLPGDNTLVLRDTVASLERILPALYAFDHPARPVEIELWLVRASGTRSVSPQPLPKKSDLPPELLRSLRNNFNYVDYDLVGRSRVRGLEGEQMTFEVAKDFSVRFRLGTIVGEQRLRLNDFEVLLDPVTGEPVPLLKSQLNLWLDRTMAMGLTTGQGSPTALLVVVRCEASPEAPRKAKPRPRGNG